MGFSHQVNRVTISGSMYGGEEEWSTGFYMGNVGADSNAPLQSIVDAIGPLWQTLFTTSANGFSNNYKTHEIKIVSLKASDGKTVPDSQVYYTYPAPITGGYATNQNPPQIATVCTLIGVAARGLASKGRMFLPGTGFSVDTNGRIPTANQTALTTGMKTFLTAVNALPEDNVILLASQGRKPPLIGGPVMHEVISIRLGNVYDTQRRRRNALTEVYTTQTL